MTRRRFVAVVAGALALTLAGAGTSRAQMGGGFFGPWGGMSPWSGTGGWFYNPGGVGFNYYTPHAFPPSVIGPGGYTYPAGMGMGMGMSAYPYVNSGYGIPSSLALSPMSYVAFYPPLYTTRAPVVAPASGLLAPADQPATVEVVVPADAAVRFDGQATSQTGAHRLYTTPDLVKGQSYHYTVTATFTQNGKPVTQAQQVRVYAGGHALVVFPSAK